MADDAKIGTIWQDDELDVIVADYFAMLAEDLSGRPYVKSRHSAALMVRIGRTHRSVEFKHQNISAVMGELGLPWIPGYKPKRNYQNAIFDAIDRYLTLHPAVLDPTQFCRPCRRSTTKFLSLHQLSPYPRGRFQNVCAGLSRNSTRLSGTTVTAPLAKPGRLLLLMLRGVSSLNPATRIWPGKSGGPPPKTATVQVTTFCPSIGQGPSA
jgi:hypothetical protein